ncbi:MAG: TlpA disulfide reductase family protein [Acidobacteriota bacterium]
MDDENRVAPVDGEEGVEPTTDKEAATDAAPVAEPQSKQANWIFALIAVAAVIALFWPSTEGPWKAPDGPLLYGEFQSTRIADQLAPVSLVHFWSTWCVPCLDEVPEIRKLAALYDGDPRFGLVMVAVADDHDNVQEFLTSVNTPVTETLYDDDWTVTKRYETDRLPETHLVVDGMVVHSFIGVTDWNDPTVRQKVAAAMAGELTGEEG